MSRSRLPALTVGLLACACAQAQNIKPGLWETTTQMQGERGGQMAGAMAEMQKQMASMPPEQRKMIEDMMAKRGVAAGPAAGGGMAVKICMTQEMISRNEVGRQKSDCTHTASPRAGNTVKFSYSCPNPPSRGEGVVTYTSPDAYSVKVTTITTIKGKEEAIEVQSNSKWLGSDCGAIKPLAAPK